MCCNALEYRETNLEDKNIVMTLDGTSIVNGSSSRNDAEGMFVVSLDFLFTSSAAPVATTAAAAFRRVELRDEDRLVVDIDSGSVFKSAVPVIRLRRRPRTVGSDLWLSNGESTVTVEQALFFFLALVEGELFLCWNAPLFAPESSTVGSHK